MQYTTLAQLVMCCIYSSEGGLALKKIAVLYGTRPEFVKVAPILELLSKSEKFELISISTGQHAEMLTQMEDQFQIYPSVTLNIFKPGQTLSEIVQKTLAGLEQFFESNMPDLFVVQGDTTSAMTGALAAFYKGIPVAHVEAGLRSFDLANPFPEEANRKVISQLSTIHLAPTPLAAQNLQAEGIKTETITVTGNTVIDSLAMSTNWNVTFSDNRVSQILTASNPYILITTHRRENIGAGMSSICDAIFKLAEANANINFLFPMHKNPAVRDAMSRLNENKNVVLCEPLSYAEFVKAMSSAFLAVTDSGGVQEEAPAFKVPVLVLRDTTERPEAIDAGVARLIGTNTERIISEVTNLINDSTEYLKMASGASPYGDGEAAKRILGVIENFFGGNERIEPFNPATR
jgi:UDP-N-acetylglucosamine 2-epimerase (non-hydrolysing)